MDVNADEGDWTADLGFGVEDEWGAMDTLASPPNIPTSNLWGSPQPLARALTPQPQIHTQARKSSSMPGRPTAISPSSSTRPTPISSPSPPDLEPAPKSTAGMSKEEKANEMARRKEERRLRIERLKEQKKGVASTAK
ncbi:hypothetical protein OG21DRAFT_275262 [Imleria badia]|nr:hypothetical protein OG21DRAFT_275262 [Imleria badia]